MLRLAIFVLFICWCCGLPCGNALMWCIGIYVILSFLCAIMED